MAISIRRDHARATLIDQQVQHVYRLRDGLVERMDILEADWCRPRGSCRA